MFNSYSILSLPIELLSQVLILTVKSDPFTYRSIILTNKWFFYTVCEYPVIYNLTICKLNAVHNNSYNLSLIEIAAQHGCLDVIKIILPNLTNDYNNDDDAIAHTVLNAMQMAYKHGHYSIPRWIYKNNNHIHNLVKHDPNINSDLLYTTLKPGGKRQKLFQAAMEGNVFAIDTLIETDRYVEFNMIMDRAINRGCVKLIKRYYKRGLYNVYDDPENIIITAVERGHHNLVSWLLSVAGNTLESEDIFYCTKVATYNNRADIVSTLARFVIQ